MILHLIRALIVLAIAIGSMPGLVFLIIKAQDHNYEAWEPASFKKNWLIASMICYFMTMVIAIVCVAMLPLSSKEKLEYQPVQEQLYRRVEP
jgi:uncharacterized membrane protein